MTTALLTLVVLAGALACPAHMLWQRRRGKQAACCGPTRPAALEELRARQRALGDEVARRHELGNRKAG